ncbi:MAG: diacylglycerol/lipid kinase family protein [Legionella sp.]
MTFIAVIINPIAGGGQGTQVWRELKPGLNALFDKILFKISNRVNDLDAITRGFLKEHPDLLLVIGGDGTLSHVLNGLLQDDKLTHLKTKLAYLIIYSIH